MNERVDTLARWALIVIAGVLILAVGLGIFSAVTGRSVSHNRLEERIIQLEDHLQFISCLLLIAPEDRLPDAVAACQISG